MYLADLFQIDITQSHYLEQDPLRKDPYAYQLPLSIEIQKNTISTIINGENYATHALNCNNILTCWLGLYRREFLLKNHIRFKEDITSCEDTIFFIDTMQWKKKAKSYFTQEIMTQLAQKGYQAKL